MENTKKDMAGNRINNGILKCDRTEKGDEYYTPFYAVEPVLKYLPAGKTVWCPFDEEWSAYSRLLRERGHHVVRSSLLDGQDFFSYEPEQWDIIVSNPPFSKKDQVLERLYGFGKPFAVLLPLATLQGRKRFCYLKNGVQLLAFDKRVCYYRGRRNNAYASGCAFASAYFCRRAWFWRNWNSMNVQSGHEWRRGLRIWKFRRWKNRQYLWNLCEAWRQVKTDSI